MRHEENIFTLLRSNGLRLTKARRAFVGILSASRTPLSGPHILSELSAAGIRVNKTTVYRELERFQKLGIIGSMRLGDRKRYYELSSHGHHHHLVCVECAHVEDVDVDESGLLREERRVSRQKQFTALYHSLEFFGLCRQCQLAG
jgi:Fur family ferric uptake transcriptional regulator